MVAPAPNASGQLLQKVREAFENVDQSAIQAEEPEIEEPAAGAAPNAPSPSWQRNTGESQSNDQLQWGRGPAADEEPQSTEPLPTPPPSVEGRLPLAGAPPADSIQLSQSANGNIEQLIVRDQPLSHVLSFLAQKFGLNIVASNDIDALISITLRDVPLEEALTAILSVANYTWVQRNNIILVTSLADATNLPADVQGRQIQVFDLDYASATGVAEAVTGFLSPIGKVTTSLSDPANNRMTRELVVVEDLPSSLARIAEYIHQVDLPPRQVLIEAHVLQVALTDETRCGVDLHALCRIAGSNVNILSVPTLAAELPSSGVPVSPGAPAFLATFASHDLQAVIDALQTTTDSKTLGSPKILVLNGQQAHIQVGETIYFSQTTATETSSQQGAEPIETGVILRITPRITQEGRVILHVEPTVSTPVGDRVPGPDGALLPPNIARIELQSDVMLRDGEGMIIGGLIDERDVTGQQKVPYLGEVKGLGWLFRRSTTTKERSEIIFALVPRIQPYGPEYQAFEQGELVKAGVPLMQGPLCRTYRPWDPVLPDGKRVYRPLIPKKPRYINPNAQPNSQYIVPPQPLPVQRFRDPHCDTEWQGASAYGPGRPLLSDEVLELPPDYRVAPQGTEIISDQD